MNQQTESGDLEGEVPARLYGARLDAVLAELFPGRSKAAFQKLVRRGKVFVDGTRVLRSNIKPRRRARIRLEADESAAAARAPQLEVVFEDEHIAVIDKPAGLLTHGNEKRRGDSLADLAQAKYGRLPILMGELRPGIVHRLDRETSGLIVLARTGVAMENLREAFRAREVRKDYLALVHGRAIDGDQSLRWDIGAVNGHPDRQQALESGRGKSAETRVGVEEHLGPCSLLRCQPRTGRRHQIRVHLQAAGATIVGDKMYGAREAPQLPAGAPELQAHGLHAQRLQFAHPISGVALSFEVPLRTEMERLVSWLRE